MSSSLRVASQALYPGTPAKNNQPQRGCIVKVNTVRFMNRGNPDVIGVE
jgi:hypothetical protein